MDRGTVKLRLSWGSGAFFRFFGELNDFLPADRRGRLLWHQFDVGGSVKDAIESFGVPHSEVGLVVVDKEPAGFSHPLESGETVAVYPEFHSIDISGLPQLRPPFPGKPAFVLDVHLGRLAAYLRLMGLDTVYGNHAEDSDLAAIASAGPRILLTRDRGLLKRNEVVYGYWIRSTEPRQQLLEVIRRYELIRHADLFGRCLVCNAVLEVVDPALVADQLPPRTRETFADLRRCPGCGRVYWKGSHYRRMLHMVGRILRAARG